MRPTTRLTQLTTLLLAATTLAMLTSCGGDTDSDRATLELASPPPSTMTASSPVSVGWTIETAGTLHHTEIRACTGERNDCGLGAMDSFDVNFAATMSSGGYTASVTLESVGSWTVVAFAHVGETPHISAPVFVTVQ